MGKDPTQNDVMNGIVVAIALEVGFLGDWCFSDEDGDAEMQMSAYQLKSQYSFDRRLLEDYAKYPQQSNSHKCFKFKFSLHPKTEILVNTLDAGDLLLIAAHLIDNSVTVSTYSIALPISRYIINRKLNSDLPSNFRNLRELSIKVKNQVFLPLRNNILVNTHHPSLDGIGSVLLSILEYLKPKDVAALSATCKCLHSHASAYLAHNKLKKS